MRVVATTRFCEPAASAASRATLQHKARRGYTLLEMIISTGAATVLLGGLMSTIVVANRAWSPDLKPAIKTEASGLTRQLGIDLKSALYFTERTSDAVTFAVPDRDSDGQPEMLRYAWSGTAGDPLTVSLNGGTAQTIVPDVQTFNMDFLLRSVTAPVIPASGQNQTIVFLSESDGGKGGEIDRSSLPTEDQARVEAIESWGFTVSIFSRGASDEDWATQIDQAAAIYVPGSIEDDSVSRRLYHTNVGVVFESSSLRDDSGYSTQKDLSTGTDIDLENTSHFITSTLSPGSIQIVKSSQPLLTLVPGLGPDLEVLGRSSLNEYYASLAVLETYARTRHDDPVPARRVLLPWGASSTPFTELTDAALTIMERSITWAAKLDDSPARRRVLYFVSDVYSFNAANFDRKIMYESAGLEVRLLNESSSSDVLTDEIANCAAVYLTAHTNTDLLLPYVVDTENGVICEGLDWTVPLGFSSNVGKGSVTTLDIKDQTHPIVDGISGSEVTITTRNFSLVTPGGTLAEGLHTILESPAKGKGSALSAVAVIEQGDLRVDGTATPGRRTFIPYYNTVKSDFTADGYRMMQQAMDWTTLQPEVAVESSPAQSFLRSLFK